MGVEIDGRLGHNDYRLRKLTQILKEKDKLLDGVPAIIEEMVQKAAESDAKLRRTIEKLEKEIRSLKAQLGYSRNRPKQPKPEVETKEQS